ncbi:hypothetical protein G7Z17_g772 [Cylindrodendrum hubeiense]|uniref:Heterokaryon incompatibility domain-containing protein n=1 Tax=Cylindrodendrum hubeiense TaxID=595255 RepID=A0A9P5HKS0_9HYPO|nr:hypothetical protein G7Z17_g772 [Cylindrodendrum hubeiense]
MPSRQLPPPEKTFSVTVWFQRPPDCPLRVEILIENDNTWMRSWNVYCEPEDPAAQWITERGVLENMNDPASYELALRCIRECASNHPRCSPAAHAKLPTRVIDCSDPDRPRLFITEGAPDGYYVALSYVWGEDQPNRTTRGRLPSYLHGIEAQRIPKTIRDAIQGTHSLGLRYLWVDAFCIIQDSDEDKAAEIATIRTIFRCAYLTIIAANAKKVSEGFLDCMFIHNSPSTLPFRCPDGGIGTIYAQSRSDTPPQPINTRAWCLEERILSTRALWYCTPTLQYECQTAHVNVDGNPNMSKPRDGIPRLPNYIFTPKLPTIPKMTPEEAEEQADQAWQSILRLYTRRDLTKPRDRLLALSGVVEYFHTFWNKSSYLAGLWKHQLPGCLLWRVECGDPEPRPTYRAPSWSWAAVDGEISSQMVTYSGAVCAVKTCYAEPKSHVNPYGEVMEGVLQLDVIIRRVVWDPVECELFEVDGQPAGVQDDYRSDRGEIGFVTVDAAEEVSSLKCEVTAAVLVQNSTLLHGILLVPTPLDIPTPKEGLSEVTGTYRRIGTFTTSFCDREVWLGTQRQVVTIV